MAVAIGVDLGTSSVQGVAVDVTGKLLLSASRTYPLLTPQPGWSEQEPLHWWAAFTAVIRELLAGLDGKEITGLAVSGQMHGLVAVDRHGEPLRPAILWNDQRTAVQAAELREAVGDSSLISRTGNPAITGFQLPKLLWLRSQEPRLFEQTVAALLPKDWLAFRLTGEYSTEPSDATGVGCLNIHSGDWDDTVLGATLLDRSLFPPVIASHQIKGHVTAEAALATGLPEGLPVVAGAGDNAAANLGLGLDSSQPERGSLSLGTSGVLFTPVKGPTPDSRGRVHLFAHGDGNWCLLGVTLAAGGSVEWFANRFLQGEGAGGLVALAAASPGGANGVSWHPYLAGERSPWLDPVLRAAFSGLSLATDLGDMARAVLEGVAFSLRDVLQVQEALTPVSELVVTGGGSRSGLWLQLIADALGTVLSVSQEAQGAAYGSALLALQGTADAGPAARLANRQVSGLVHPQRNTALEEAWARWNERRPQA